MTAPSQPRYGEDAEPGSLLPALAHHSRTVHFHVHSAEPIAGPVGLSETFIMAIKRRVAQNTDPLLHPFLQAEDEPEAQRLLKQLIADHAQPLVREIVCSKLRAGRLISPDGRPLQETDDICDEVVVQLLGRLRELRDAPGDVIGNFRGYVATVAYNSCAQTLRQSHPERHRLKNRLRYLLNHDERFALWGDSSGISFCGLAEWRDATPPLEPSDYFETEVICEQDNLRQLPPRALLNAVFSILARPLELEELVSLAAKIWGTEELQRIDDRRDDDGAVWDKLPDPRVNVAVLVERRMHLAALWKEICELRPLQRAALLLNLHDASGQDMLPLLVLTDVARFSEIAESLNMTIQEFSKLWDELPLDDATIAQRIRLTRQQVINLRKSARERLARRMSKLW